MKRGRRKKAVDPTPAQSAGTRSRRRGKSGSPAAATNSTRSGKKTSPSDDITDEDLTKAASQAAQVIGAPAVMEVLEEFAVSKLGDLQGDQRQEFLDRMQAERDANED